MNYEHIFARRGAAYAGAMARWPQARREEFLLPLAKAGVVPGQTVIDVPAGGGDMARYVPAGVRWLGHEPCASFFDGQSIDQPLLPLPWRDASADAALSLAGAHHLDERGPLYREVHRVLRPGGRFVLADVHRDSAVASFLDDFVGAHNSTGHRGHYLGEADLALLESSGFAILDAARESYAWWFEDRIAMGAFCRLLFDMHDIPAAAVAEAIEARLGTREHGGEVGMCWELYMVVAQRHAPARAAP